MIMFVFVVYCCDSRFEFIRERGVDVDVDVEEVVFWDDICD